jgi:hypothetical protein
MSTEPAIDTIPLAELLDAEDRPSSGGRRVAGRPPRQPLPFDDLEARGVSVDVDVPTARYQSATNSKIVDNPLALAARSSKQRLIGGKQVKFGTGRQYTAVVLFFVLAAAGYAGFWFFVYGIKYIQDAGDTAKNYREKMAKADEIAKANKKKALGGDAEPEATPAPGDSKTAATPATQSMVEGDAGTPVRVGDWEVCVLKAEVGQLDLVGPLPRLMITVRVTNLAPGRQTYSYWSQPGNGASISNQNMTPIPVIRWRESNEKERKLESKESYDDVLVVDQGAANFELDAKLLFPGTPRGCVIHIPRGFVTRMQQ